MTDMISLRFHPLQVIYSPVHTGIQLIDRSVSKENRTNSINNNKLFCLFSYCRNSAFYRFF